MWSRHVFQVSCGDETVVLVPVIAVVGQDEVRRGKINH
jgi:hypothetical protein